jgi:hypothetical protein
MFRDTKKSAIGSRLQLPMINGTTSMRYANFFMTIQIDRFPAYQNSNTVPKIRPWFLKVKPGRGDCPLPQF